MNRIILLLVLLISITTSRAQIKFIGKDVDNFWIAYDKITSTTDSGLQKKYIKELYLDKGTPGLQSLVQVRNYTDKEFIAAINNYPKFWQSIKANTQHYRNSYPEIKKNIEKLGKFYSSLRPATIYFSIGVFRAGGTILQDRVLIGSELSLADKHIVTDELPAWLQAFYRHHDPINDIGLLCTHEYIHTQQKEPVSNLLSYCIYEGVAEFISCLATGKKSNTPGVAFGKANKEKVITKFMQDIFFYRMSDWLWGENTNELKERDLGYYIGYEICETYYNQSHDKQKAIRELIELDYTNEAEVERIVDATRLFPSPLKKMWEDYNEKRPTVVDIQPLQADKKVKPGLLQLAITFSEGMDTYYRGFDFGPLGENHIYRFKRLVGWSNDDKTLTIEVEVDPDKKIQTVITSQFRNKQGIRLKPFLIEFETSGL